MDRSRTVLISPPIHLNRDFPVTSLDFRLDISEHHLGILPEDIISSGSAKVSGRMPELQRFDLCIRAKLFTILARTPQIARDQCGMLAARTLAVILASDNDRLTFH